MFKATPTIRVLLGSWPKVVRLGVAFFLAAVLFVTGVLMVSGRSEAATQSTINFQARLQSATGAIAPDGYYNVQFKLYDASTGGNLLWTETYGYNGGSPDQRVRVQNGYLSVPLGSITAFPGTINWDQQLYLTMNIGGSTTTASYDGEMNPRLALTAVPYAFRAGQLATNNGAYTSTLTLAAPSGGNQNFVVPDQGAAGTYNLLTQNTANANYIQNTTTTQSGANFNIGGNGVIGGNATVNGTLNVAGNANFTGAVGIGNSTTGSLNGFTSTLNNSGANNFPIAIAGTLNDSATTASSTALKYAGQFTYNKNGSAADTGYENGALYIGANINNGSASNIWNIESRIQVASGATITNAYDFVADAQYGSGGTVTNRAGFNIRDFNKASGQTLTNQYGILISNLYSGANNYSIYTGNAQSYFGGAVTVQGALTTQGGISNNNAGIAAVGPLSGVTTITASGAITSASLSATGNVSGSTLTSTVANGTAPLTVASQTKVTNLNADLLDGLDSTAFATASGSANYIQNTTTQQSTANFNISGNGVLGGTLTTIGTITTNGSVNIGGTFQLNGQAGITSTCTGGQMLANANIAGGIVVGGSCSAAGAGTVNAIGPIDSQTKSADGAVISGNNLVMQSADASNPGLVTTGAQTLAGDKTLTGNTTANGNLTVNGNNTLIKNTANNNNTFAVQNAAGTNLLRVDTSLGRVFVGDSTSSFPKLTFGDVGSSGNNAYISEYNASDSDALQLQGRTGIYLTTGSTPTVNFSLNGTGQAVFKNSADSTTAFQIQNAGGAGVVTVDTANRNLTLGSIVPAATAGAEMAPAIAAGNYSGTNWTVGTNSATHTAGSTAPLSPTTALTVVPGGYYRIVFTISANTNGLVTPAIGGVSGTNNFGTPGTYTTVIRATGTGNLQLIPQSAFNGTISAISVVRMTTTQGSLAITMADGTTAAQLRVGSASTSGASTLSQYFGAEAGINALGSATQNAAYGGLSMQDLTSGSYNSAFGALSLSNNTTGSENTAIGNTALYYNQQGGGNTAVGTFAGNGVITGNYNTFLGYSAGNANTDGAVQSGVVSKATAIGYRAIANCSNCMVLGGVGSDAINVGIGTINPQYALDVVGDINTSGNLRTGGTVRIDNGGNATLLSLQLGNSYPLYRYTSAGATDLNWKNLGSITIGTGQYQGMSFQVDVNNANGNAGSANETGLKFYATFNASGATQGDTTNAAVSGPQSEYVRAVRTSANGTIPATYQLQVRQPVNYQTVTFQVQVTSQSGNSAWGWNGPAPATGSAGTAIYMPAPIHTDYFTKLNVNGGAIMNYSGVAQAGAITGVQGISGQGFSISATGAAQFNNTANSTTAFQVLNAANLPLFTIDSTNAVAYVGTPGGDTTGALLVLGNKTNAGDPAGQNGAMYYSAVSNRFRCYENGAWRDCITRPLTNRYIQTTAQAYANTTNTPVRFNTNPAADGGLTTPDNTGFTITKTGTWQLSASMRLSPAVGASGERYMSILDSNGNTYAQTSVIMNANSIASTLSASTTIRLAAGTVVGVNVYQSSGQSVNSDPSITGGNNFSLTWIGD